MKKYELILQVRAASLYSESGTEVSFSCRVCWLFFSESGLVVRKVRFAVVSVNVRWGGCVDVKTSSSLSYACICDKASVIWQWSVHSAHHSEMGFECMVWCVFFEGDSYWDSFQFESNVLNYVQNVPVFLSLNVDWPSGVWKNQQFLSGWGRLIKSLCIVAGALNVLSAYVLAFICWTEFESVLVIITSRFDLECAFSYFHWVFSMWSG